MKKGQFFIIILPSIAFILFMISLIMYQYSISFEDRLTEFAVFDKMNNLDQSIQYALKNIFNEKSGIKVNVTSNTIYIEDSIPFSHSQLNSSLDSLKHYVETNFDSVNLSVETIKRQIPLYIKSHNMLYTHPGLSNISLSSPYASIVNGYDLVIIVNQNFVSSSCNIQSGGNKRLFISIQLANGSTFQCSSLVANFVATPPYNNVALTFPSGTMSVYIGSTGNVEIYIPSGITATIRSSIYLSDNYYKPEIVFPTGTIIFNYKNFGVYKNGDSKIA